MNTMSSAQWILAATLAVAAVVVPLILAGLARLVRGDGYGSRPAPVSHADWSNGSLPSRPYSLHS